LIADTALADFAQFISDNSNQDIVDEALMHLNMTLNTDQNQYALQMVNTFRDMVTPLLMFYGALVGYQQGMLCFACDPNWSQSYDETNFSMLIQSSTCDSVYDGTSRGWDVLEADLPTEISLLINILNNTQQFRQKYAPVIGFLSQILMALNEEDLCSLIDPGRDCKYVTCNDMLRGPSIGLSFSSKLDTFMSSIITSLITHSVMPILNTFLNSPLMDISITNKYSDDPNAYAAYDIGCSSQLSGYACTDPYASSSSSSSNTRTIAIVCIILGIAACGGSIYGALWWIRRPRPSTLTSADGGAASGTYTQLSGGVQ